MHERCEFPIVSLKQQKAGGCQKAPLSFCRRMTERRKPNGAVVHIRKKSGFQWNRQTFWDQSCTGKTHEKSKSDDRRRNAELFEDAFYNKKNLDPQLHEAPSGNTVQVPEGVDAELLSKVLSNPEMAALLSSLAKSMQK